MNKEEKFLQFWKIYPRKVAKVAAQRSWKRLKVKDIDDIFKVYKEHLIRWRGTDIQFVPHASTWINQRRWEDELEPLPENKSSIYRNIENERKTFIKKIKVAEENMASDEERKEALKLMKKGKK
tara:strand:+ start:94 stop:465 length:372 start_codon:yes stop_codon:yes gene_type:complete